MSEYWKSNPRKFCDFCKCWFADNRSSIEFHERGKRHQEAVKQRLSELAKKGKQDEIDRQQLSAEMQQMEKAALAAFKKDLVDNPELAKQYGVNTSKKKDSAGGLDGAPLPQEGPVYGPTMEGAPIPQEAPTENAGPEKKWHEAKSDEGYSYYWNIDTGAAVWEPPEEGYVALPDCAPPEPVKQEPAVKQEPGESGRATVNREPVAVKQERVVVKQEQEEEQEPPAPGEERLTGPANRPDPYGSKWEAVVREEPAGPVDLELPEQRQPKVRPTVKGDKPRIVFRQKAVKSLGGSGDETFKRRNTDASRQRNIRQRTDD